MNKIVLEKYTIIKICDTLTHYNFKFKMYDISFSDQQKMLNDFFF